MKKLSCATLEGIEAKVVDVESTLTKGLPSFSIVGLASTDITEAKERVKSALLSNEYKFPPKRITFLLAPSEMGKSGSHFDLCMALLILLHEEEQDFSDWFVFGELGLDGSVKENIQLYPLILSLANQNSIKKAIVPKEALPKLQKIPNITFVGVSSVNEAVDLLKNQESLEIDSVSCELEYPNFELNEERFYYTKEYKEDFIDVKGQEVAKRAAIIAAAGFHNILLEGSPGCGKSMIANRLRYILPALKTSEILDTAKLDVLEGVEPQFKPHRTFKSPHHSSTSASIFGGGCNLQLLMRLYNNKCDFFKKVWNVPNKLDNK
ncbi:magnesium chelatase domain-containing protein [Sulfurimonas sp.]|uniref:magnesium chelatase domain-containing protein n=1 Tax=Sulfurimonas sp. TaxID=2022749 RepID=UPI003D0C4726